MLMMIDPLKYCEYACVKIAAHLKKAANVELVRMRCIFLQDDFDKIWLHSLSEVWIRSQNPHFELKSIRNFISDLETHEQAVRDKY